MLVDYNINHLYYSTERSEETNLSFEEALQRNQQFRYTICLRRSDQFYYHVKWSLLLDTQYYNRANKKRDWSILIFFFNRRGLYELSREKDKLLLLSLEFFGSTSKKIRETIF